MRLADIVDRDELRAELDHARSLRFNNSELHYLRGTNEYGDRMFTEDYLQFLRQLRLPDYELEEKDGSFRMQFHGLWSETIYWETVALALLNELYNRSLLRKLSPFEQDLVYARGRLNLAEKIRSLREHPEVEFVDFALALIGVTVGLLMTDQPFGFMALLGFLALSGMLIKNAIVLVDQIDLEVREGKPTYTAIVDSGVSRLRPVAMAAATTMLGMIPLFGDAFYIAMAVTIVGGLAVATVLTMIIVPVFYAILFRAKEVTT